MENLYLLIFTLIAYLIITYYATGKDVLSPPIIMILVFIISTCFAAVNGLNWKIDFSTKSYFLLSSGILSFVIPYIILHNIRIHYPRNVEATEAHIIHIEKWKIIVTIAIDLVILYLYRREIFRLVGSSGYSGSNIQWAFRNLTSYEGSESLSGYIRLLTKFIDASSYIFAFVFINNVIIYKCNLRKNIYMMIPTIIFCIKTILSGGRLDLLKLLAFCFISLYLQNHNKVGWNKNISIKYIIYGIGILIVVLPGFYYALSLVGRETTRSLFVSISTYVGGSIKQFDQYVGAPVEKSPYWGNECFIPILNMLGKYGIINYHRTVHLEYRQLGITIGNVYTFFRRPLQDFGIMGMYLFTLAVSIFFSIIYLWYIKFTSNTLYNNVCTIIYSYLLYWIVLSSIEQYSITIISVQTVLTLIVIYMLFKFYTCVQIKSSKLIIYKWDRLRE